MSVQNSPGHHSPSTPPSAGEGYDRQVPFLPGVIAAGVFLLLFLCVSGFGIRSYFTDAHFDEAQRKIAQVPTTDWDNLKESSRKRLDSYGWNDEKAGTVHIPIQRAMELVMADAKNAPADKPADKKAKPADKKTADKKPPEKKTTDAKPAEKAKAKK